MLLSPPYLNPIICFQAFLFIDGILKFVESFYCKKTEPYLNILNSGSKFFFKGNLEYFYFAHIKLVLQVWCVII